MHCSPVLYSIVITSFPELLSVSFPCPLVTLKGNITSGTTQANNQSTGAGHQKMNLLFRRIPPNKALDVLDIQGRNGYLYRSYPSNWYIAKETVTIVMSDALPNKTWAFGSIQRCKEESDIQRKDVEYVSSHGRKVLLRFLTHQFSMPPLARVRYFVIKIGEFLFIEGRLEGGLSLPFTWKGVMLHSTLIFTNTSKYVLLRLVPLKKLL